MQEGIGDFIKGLANISDGEIQEYVGEITSNSEFHNSLDARGYKARGEVEVDPGKVPFSLSVLAIFRAEATALYALIRKLKPDVVVETGVASGVSSSYILCALHENEHGQLYSIDVPWHTMMTNWSRYFPVEDQSKVMPQERQSGWIIPDYLRNRWQLIVGTSSEKLPSLLEKLVRIDIFLHDSLHTYENMLWEYQTAWKYIKVGGILLSHNAYRPESAFSFFCKDVGTEACVLNQMCGIARP